MSQIHPQKEIDLEANVLFQKTKYRSKLCGGLCAILLISLFTSPFIITDLYFAFNTEPCQFIENEFIHFTLNIWLKVIAFTNIAVLVLVFIIFVLVKDKDLLEIIKILLKIIIGGFSLAWMITGSILFWKYNGKYCDRSLYEYMYARLIIGLITCILSCCKCK